MTHTYNCGTIVIANGGTTPATPLAADPHFQHADYLLIAAPSALTAANTVQVSLDGGTTYVKYQIEDGAGGLADVAVGAGDVARIPVGGFTHITVIAAGAEGAERTFTVNAVETLR